MKSNTSLFKSQVGSKRRWEKWNENLYNKFLPTTADSTSSSFHDKCRASFRILWNSVYLNAFDSHISLCSSGNSAALCLSNGNTINLCTSSSDISFGRLEESAGDIYVYVGETSGTISIFLFPPSHSQVHLIAKSHASPSSPVDFIHPFQGEHDPTNTIHLWVITGQNMYLLSGSYCSPTFEQARSSSTETIELSARAQFQLALPRSSSLLFVQVNCNRCANYSR